MKLNILAVGVHPDDVELGCSGTLLAHLAKGHTAGILDLTRGELGTRGNPELRAQEAAAAARILGISVRENLGMADGFFTIDEAHLRPIIRIIRRYRPDLVLCNAVDDRHPDHARAAKLVSEACFLAGLRKISIQEDNGQEQEAWRPEAVYHYIQDYWIDPDVIVDISPYMDKKMEAVLAFSSQFHQPGQPDNEPETAISTPQFMEHVRSRALQMGRLIKAQYGEGFTTERPAGVNDLFHLR